MHAWGCLPSYERGSWLTSLIKLGCSLSCPNYDDYDIILLLSQVVSDIDRVQSRV